MKESRCVELGKVKFPEFIPERHYMIPFKIGKRLPDELVRWQDTVDQMTEHVKTKETCYLMIDSAPVEAGKYHRRPGVHVDGYWHPGIYAHNFPTYPSHRSDPPGHRSARHCAGGDDWATADLSSPEAIVLASNVGGCRGYVGVWDGPLQHGGDARSVDLSQCYPVDLSAGRAYAGNAAFLHESLPMLQPAYRQLVRINTPGWTV